VLLKGSRSPRHLALSPRLSVSNRSLPLPWPNDAAFLLPSVA